MNIIIIRKDTINQLNAETAVEIANNETNNETNQIIADLGGYMNKEAAAILAIEHS